ncbi:cytochrome P450 [Promicromonospora soli]
MPILLPEGVPAWGITDPVIMRDLMSGADVSKDKKYWKDYQDGNVPENWSMLPWVGGHAKKPENAFHAGGDDHRRLRRPMVAAFTSRRIRALRPQIERITAQVLARLENAGRRGRMVDLRQELAFPVPIEVISALLGIPDNLRPQFRTCVDRIFDTTISSECAQANQVELGQVLQELVEFKKTHPGDDLTTDLLADLHPSAAPGDDSGAKNGKRSKRKKNVEPAAGLTDREVLGTIRLVITAGFETTVNLIDQAITLLLTHPQWLGAVQADRITWAAVVEEALRYESPVACAPLRYARTDLRIRLNDQDGVDGGENQDGTVLIPEGDAVLMFVGAAGRDPLTHDEPGVFDPTRQDMEHLAFGWGPHHCVGATLAIEEALITLRDFFARFPGIRLAVDVADLGANRGFITNGHARLPVYLYAPSSWARMARRLSLSGLVQWMRRRLTRAFRPW